MSPDSSGPANTHLKIEGFLDLFRAEILRDQAFDEWLRGATPQHEVFFEYLEPEGENRNRNLDRHRRVFKQLASIDESAQAAFEDRITGALMWLADNPEMLRALSQETWLEVFSVLRPLKGGSLSESLKNLMTALETNAPSFLDDREMRRDFTDLISRHQLDNDLERRWLSLIEKGKEDSDPILYESLVGSMRGLFSMPANPSKETVETAMGFFFQRLQAAKTSDELRRECYEKVVALVESREPLERLFLDSVESVRKIYSWLP
jgi:hypothetical protein